MKINKKELKKISRKFRSLVSNAMNAYFREQKEDLLELMNYVDNTPLLKEYIDSLSYEINTDDLKKDMEEVNKSYGHQALDLGSDSDKKTYLLYQVFTIILKENMSPLNFGWFYSGGGNYQGMAKAFGDRLIYPFASTIGEYMKDIATDMGYDENNSYNITINSSGVQVNIAENNSNITATQTNSWNIEEVKKVIEELENNIKGVEDEATKNTLSTNLELVKNEITKDRPNKSLISTTIKTIHFLASMVAMIPDLSSGVNMLAALLGIII